MRRLFVAQKLRSTLTQWFLVVAIPPIIFVSLLGYINAKNSLEAAITSELMATAASNKAFIENWFFYRKEDVETLSEFFEVAPLLESLSTDFERSNKNLHSYTQSFDWQKVVFEHDKTIRNFSGKHEYIYDIFLIDKKSNVLFSITKEDDLGTNLSTGPYADTLFAKTVNRTLHTGETLYSDLERYEPSNHIVASFFTAAIVDDNGDRIGVFAIQVRIDRILDALFQSKHGAKQHYLVGSDARLRSVLPHASKIIKKMGKANLASLADPLTSVEDWVLRKEINLVRSGVEYSDGDVSTYRGPLGYDVVGIQNAIKILNVDWILVSEVEETVAFASVYWLRTCLLIIVLLSIVGITVFTFAITRRITDPIRYLSQAAKLAAKGNLEQRLHIDTDDEIADLADTLQEMLDARRDYELKLINHNLALETAMFELEEQRVALAEHAIVAITDLSGIIIYANQKLADISGYELEEIIGKNHSVLTSEYHSKNFLDDFFACIYSGNVWQGVMCNRHKHGSLYWASTTVVPVKNIDGSIKHYISLLTDITEQKNTELALEDERERAQAANQAKSDFLACMSHEIRTPMNGVLGMLGLLRRTTLTPDQARKADIAETSAKSLLTIINDILDFSKIDAGKLTLEAVDFDVTGLLSDIADAYAFKAEEKGLELILDTHKVDQTRVIGDPIRIRQIVTNLLGNALKFTLHGEVLIRVSTQLVDAERVRICLEVQDSGIGIPAEKQADLFAAFTQADTSTTRQYGGTGLGLSIVRQLCDLMDGRVNVTSEPGSGSCFSCEIYLGKGSVQTPLMPPIDFAGKRVLVVDDNAVNLSIFSEQLKNENIAVVCVSSAEEAIHYLQQASSIDAANQEASGPLFDAAIIDFQMPDTNGAMLGKILKGDDRWRDIPLIIMTSQGQPGDVSEMASYGFSGFFTKPTPSAVLYQALAIIFEHDSALEEATPLLTADFIASLTQGKHEWVAEKPPIDEPVDLSDLTIMLVEDNSVNQELVSFLLADTQAVLVIANHGQEALDLLNNGREKIDIILMDCQMPILDGFATSQAIRKGNAGARYETIPIIAMTANAMKEDRARCIDAGMDDYISKPIDENLLMEALTLWQLKVKPEASVVLADGDCATPEPLVWDYDAILKRVGNKPERVVKLIATYLQSETSIVADLQKHIALRAYGDAITDCHTLRGVAGNMSALALMHCSQKLEAACRAEDVPAITEQLAFVLEAKRRLNECLVAYQQTVN